MVGREGMKWAGGNRKGKDDKDTGLTKKDKVLGFSCRELGEKQNSEERATLPPMLVAFGMRWALLGRALWDLSPPWSRPSRNSFNF